APKKAGRRGGADRGLDCRGGETADLEIIDERERDPAGAVDDVLAVKIGLTQYLDRETVAGANPIAVLELVGGPPPPPPPEGGRGAGGVACLGGGRRRDGLGSLGKDPAGHQPGTPGGADGM